MSVEHWYSDLGQSELFLGLKSNQDCHRPAGHRTGNGRCGHGGAGRGRHHRQAGSVALTSQYFTSPTAANGAGLAAAVNGAVCIGGVPVATITGATLDIASNYTGDAVVGSNIKALPVRGPGVGHGADHCLLRLRHAPRRVLGRDGGGDRDGVLQRQHRHERVHGLRRVASQDWRAAKDDGEKALVQTIPFQALERVSGGGAGTAYDQTTLAVQDSWPPDPPARRADSPAPTGPGSPLSRVAAGGRHGHNHHPRKPWTPPSPYRSIST